MKIFTWAIWILSICTISFSTQAQSFSRPTAAQLDSFRVLQAAEKLFVHTDQTTYLTGETLWMSVYLVDASLHLPAHLSKVAYVELLTESGKPALQAKVAIESGRGDGTLFLPASLNSGHYLLRAYTRWMRNGKADFFHEQPLTIINPFTTLEAHTATQKPDWDMQFFPEGGQWIVGAPTRLGFKVLDPLGKSANLKGWILAGESDTITTIETAQNGLGHVELTPQPGVEYRAEWQLPNGQTKQTPVPTALESGYGLHLVAKNEALEITVSLRQTGDRELYLLGHCRQIPIVEQREIVQGNQAVFRVPVSSLKEGIHHFTVFNTAGQPVAERLYFAQPKAPLDVRSSGNMGPMGTRQAVEIDFSSQPHTRYSMSVYRLDSLQTSPPLGIDQYLLLLSDLRGQIENPAQYFAAGSAAKADDLMLTHGWRRFKWEEITAPKAPSLLAEIRFPMVHGRVVNKATGQIAVGIPVYFSIPGKNFRFYGAKSLPQTGEIFFEIQDFAAKQTAYLQLHPQQDSLYRIELFPAFSTEPNSHKLSPFVLSANRETDLLNRSIHMQVENIFGEQATSTTDEELPEHFYGQPDQRFYLDDYTRFPVMEEVMREYVPSILVRKRKGEFVFIAQNWLRNSVFGEEPTILLDGYPIFDTDQIMAMNPLNIKRLDIMARQYFWGPLTFSGLTSYQSYTGDLGGFDPMAQPQKPLAFEYAGILPQREFYTPQYDASTAVSSRYPDFRQLLYWQPNGQTDASGKASERFFTSDQEGTYQVVLQALAPNGQAIQKNWVIEVKRER